MSRSMIDVFRKINIELMCEQHHKEAALMIYNMESLIREMANQKINGMCLLDLHPDGRLAKDIRKVIG